MVPSGSPASTIFRRALFATTAVLGVAVLGGVAHADIMFDPGNDPQPDEQNILFGQFNDVTSFSGNTNMTKTPIEFNVISGITTPVAGENDLDTDGKGQGLILCDMGCFMGLKKPQLTDIEIKLPSGVGATDFIGNLVNGEGTFDVAVTNIAGKVFDFTLGNGQNFFTLTATMGDVITDIQVTPETADSSGNIGFDQFKQPRVSGLCTIDPTTGNCTPIPIPEPSSLALLGAGLFAAGWFSTRKKFRNLTMTT